MPKAIAGCVKKDFQQVYQEGKKYSLFGFYFFFLQSDKRMLGVVVSKKYAKSAVIRNRVKRIVKEVVRLDHGTTPTGTVIVVVKPSTRKVKDDRLFDFTRKQWENFTECLQGQ